MAYQEEEWGEYNQSGVAEEAQEEQEEQTSAEDWYAPNLVAVGPAKKSNPSARR
jgi:hypothetical protein